MKKVGYLVGMALLIMIASSFGYAESRPKAYFAKGGDLVDPSPGSRINITKQICVAKSELKEGSILFYNETQPISSDDIQRYVDHCCPKCTTLSAADGYSFYIGSNYLVYDEFKQDAGNLAASRLATIDDIESSYVISVISDEMRDELLFFNHHQPELSYENELKILNFKHQYKGTDLRKDFTVDTVIFENPRKMSSYQSYKYKGEGPRYLFPIIKRLRASWMGESTAETSKEFNGAEFSNTITSQKRLRLKIGSMAFGN